jgi:hypothetical protein
VERVQAVFVIPVLVAAGTVGGRSPTAEGRTGQLGEDDQPSILLAHEGPLADVCPRARAERAASDRDPTAGRSHSRGAVDEMSLGASHAG